MPFSRHTTLKQPCKLVQACLYVLCHMHAAVPWICNIKITIILCRSQTEMITHDHSANLQILLLRKKKYCSNFQQCHPDIQTHTNIQFTSNCYIQFWEIRTLKKISQLVWGEVSSHSEKNAPIIQSMLALVAFIR